MIRMRCELDCIFKTFCGIFGDFGPKILEKEKIMNFQKNILIFFGENFAKFSVDLVIFGCQIHEEPFFRFQVQIKAGALFSIFPPILNFQKWSKFMIFHQEKSEIQDFSYF